MVATAGRGWHLAASLVALVDEADALAPSRSTASDGSIGDPSHASRTSDHNPANGWVTAVDITDDDAAGMNARSLVDHLVATRDHRVKYLIHEGTIWRSYDKPGLPAWTAQKYTGANGHFQHAHISILNTPAARDDTSSWFDTVVHEPTAPPSEETLMSLTYSIDDLVDDTYTEARKSRHDDDDGSDVAGRNYWKTTIALADDKKATIDAMRTGLKLKPWYA